MSLIQCKRDGAKARASAKLARGAAASGLPRFLRGKADHKGDPLEHEADRAADRAVRDNGPGPSTSRTADGARLDPGTRRHMEKHLGGDLSGVRVHTGAGAASSAVSMNALAYTRGQDISFAQDQYAPDSKNGQRLLAHELAHVVQQSGGGNALSPATAGAVQKYGHKDSCSEEFLKSHVWPGDHLAKKMLPHALNALCAAQYGNPTSRNRQAAGQMRAVFGADWKGKAPEIYKNLWRLRSAFDGSDYMYDCITGCDSDDKGDEETKFADTTLDGGPGSDINLCYENLQSRDVSHFAMVVIHEMGHMMLGLEHGEDEKSGQCSGGTDDTHCYGLLARSMWERVDPVYTTGVGDLCEGGGGDYTRRPSNWD